MHCTIGRSLDERLIFVAIVNELFIYPIGSSRFFVTFVVVVCLENMSSGTQQKSRVESSQYILWQYGLSSFQAGGIKLVRF